MIIADDRIMTMAIYNMTKPQNGETNATPSGLVNHSFTYYYNHNTPSGLLNCGYSAIYKPYTPSGLVNHSFTYYYNYNTPLGLNS